MAKPHLGVINLLPGFLKPVGLKFAYQCYLGSWSPFGLMKPLREEDWPHDLWQGDSEIGKPIANKRFVLAGCDISFSRNVGWYSKEGSIDWLRALHGFEWMRDVLAHAPDKQGGKLLRNFIWDWIASSDHLHDVAFEPDVMGARLANWVIHGRFLQGTAQPAFRRKFQQQIVEQVLDLDYSIGRGEAYGFDAVRGLLLVALTMPQCGFLFPRAMDVLMAMVLRVSREGAADEPFLNPARLHHAIRCLLDIHAALSRIAGIENPAILNAACTLRDRLVHVLHGDGGFALFHGATEGARDAIRQTLAQVAALATPEAPHGPTAIQPGYARLQAGDTAIMVDVSHPTHVSPDTYFSTLAFEMSHGAQRVVVNCGAFIGNDPTWSRVVRTTAAHSTICVDDRNSAPKDPELQREMGHAPLRVEHRLVTRDGYQFFEGDYNGYVYYSGLVHSRQLLVNEAGTRFSGADHLKLLEGEGMPEARSHDVNLRFHLHPSLNVRRLMNGMVIILSEDGKQEWTFHASVGQAVELEESIYLGLDGRPTSCYQIVIYAPFTPDRPWAIEWSFIKA